MLGLRRIRRLLWVAGGVALLAVLLGGNTLSQYFGWLSPRQTPREISRLLAPAYRASLPEGSGPFPTALLFSGCDGPKDNMDRWARSLNRAGWGAVIIDSHGPRGYSDAQLWRLICAGQLLPGAERAGDVAVAIEDARHMEGVDPDRLLLLGASHGGWSILDMVSLHGRNRRPHGLSRWPMTIRDRGLQGILGLVLLYPYCGAGSQVARFGWQEDVPTLFLLVDGDTITGEEACVELAERMASRGKDVTTVMLKGTTHGFDQVEKNAFSMLEFSPEATRQAEVAILAFLDRLRVSQIPGQGFR